MKIKEITAAFWQTLLQVVGIHEQQDWYEETEIAQDARGWYLTADPRQTRYQSEERARKVATCNCYRIKEGSPPKSDKPQSKKGTFSK